MQYLWELEVTQVEGNGVTLSNGTTKTLTDRQLQYMLTDEPKDLTAERNLMLDNCVADILRVLEEHDVQKWDVDAIIQTIVGSYNENFLKATAIAFGVQGYSPASELCVRSIRMSDISRLLTQ